MIPYRKITEQEGCLRDTQDTIIETSCLPTKRSLQLKKYLINKTIEVYANFSREAAEVVGRVQRDHHQASVMVWWSILDPGTTQRHFCEQGVETTAKTSINKMFSRQL